MQIQQTEREEWYRDPVTQEFLENLKASREATKENWANQMYHIAENAEYSARLNLYALAEIDMLQKVINMIEEARPQPQRD